MKKHWPLLLCCLVLLVVASVQRVSVPLYDGVALPDEPYRYVTPPSGKATKKPPTEAHETGLMADGFNKDGVYLNTDEQGPQIYVSFTQHAFAATVQATIVEASIKPVAADGSIPPTGKVAGNMYHMSASSDRGKVTYAANNDTPSYIDMRLPQGYPVGATMVYRTTATSTWKSLVTNKVGSDIYESKVAGLGDYALTSTATPASSSNKKILIGVPLTAVALVATAIFLIRRRSSHSLES